jgi:hypothetical protein
MTQSRKHAPEGFYTAKESMALIGIPSSSFYNLVKAGTIKAIMLPGRKEAVYMQQSIDRYARQMQNFLDKLQNEISFYVALPSDLPDVHELLKSNGPGVVPPVPVPLMEAWLRRNPECIHIMRRGDRTIGYFVLFPLSREIIMGRMKGELMHRDLPLEAIGRFTPGQPLLLYVADAVVSLAENHRSVLGVRLIREMMRFLHRLAAQGIELEELYTVGTSAYGIKVCRSLGMEPLDLPTGVSEKRIPFRLDVATSTAPDIIEYRRLLRASQLVGEGE